MLSLDVFRISSRSFKNNRLRTFLTILGISVGIGTIFFLVALGYGLQKLIIENIASEDALLALDVTKKNDNIKLDQEGLNSIREIPEIENAFPLVNKQARIERDVLSSDIQMNLTDSAYFGLENIKLEKGDFFSNDGDGIVVSKATLQLLGLDLNNGLGQEVDVFIQKDSSSVAEENLVQKKYKIKGVLKEASGALIYASLGGLADEVKIEEYSKVKVKAVGGDKVSLAKNKIIEKGFYVGSISELVDQAKQVFNVVNIMLVLFGAVALIVSAIGMFNTMTIALLERTQEIGTMKALGASKSDIWKMFLMESMMIGFIGGTGGLLIGFAFSKILNIIVNTLAKNFGGISVELFYFPVWFVFFIVIFSTLVGLITGFYPAKRAAKLNALEALRYK
jgi:ABC-type antimicrobial peptide transport system permease subunit